MKVILFLADGFEEVEAVTVIDYLRRKDIVVDAVSITEDKKVEGAHKISVIADKLIEEIKDISCYDGVIIPGGIPGATNLMENEKVIDVVKKVNENNKLIAAICAGPIVLQKAGIIKGKRVTSYPGFKEELKDGVYSEENAVKDGNIITARGPAIAIDFAIRIIEHLLGEDKAQELKEDILYNSVKSVL